MEDKIKFAQNVMLIDVAFLNDVALNIRTFLSRQLGRELPDIDLPEWLGYLALDAGLREGDNEIQVLLLHQEGIRKLSCCQPSRLDDLNAKACRVPLGEMAFACVTPAGITTCEALFLDLLTLALDAADVKRLMLVPSLSYSSKVGEELEKLLRDKNEEERAKAVCFLLEKPSGPVSFQWDSVSYSLARAFGVRPDELK